MPHTPRRESAAERRLTQQVVRRGGLSYKLAPTTAGLPDRLIIWPGGRVHFVEMKADGGHLAPIQVHRINELRTAGCDVHVVYGTAGVDAYITTHAPG